MCLRVADCKSVENLGSEIMERLNEKNRLKRSGSNYSKVIYLDQHHYHHPNTISSSIPSS
jgi:hypothetical protein